MRRLAAKGPWALALALAVLAGSASGALSYWEGSGSGSATAVLASPQALSFKLGGSTAELYPGGGGEVATVASNPNLHPVQIDSIVLDPGAGQPFAVDPDHSGCDVAVLGFVPQDNEGAGWQVPPRTGVTPGQLSIDMPLAMQMSSDAADACQGASFTVRLVAGP